jgi:Ion channel
VAALPHGPVEIESGQAQISVDADQGYPLPRDAVYRCLKKSYHSTRTDGGIKLSAVIFLVTLLYAFLFFGTGIDRVTLVKSSVSVFAILFMVIMFSFDASGIEFISIGFAVSIWLYLIGTLFYGKLSEREPNTIEYRTFSIPNVIIVILCTIVIYARAYYFDGIADCANKGACKDMLSAIYFSIVTWTTLGYGDLAPKKDFYLTAASQALLGYVGMSLVIGIVTSKLSKFLDQ